MKQQILKSSALPSIVFFTGACVLILEVVATRILSPYFGNTIFTVSSVISVVLAALSLGYFYGGRLADKRPDFRVFAALIFAGGISVLSVYVLMVIFLPMAGNALSIVTGPLISSLILFFVPSALLGTLSPFAIKLQTMLTPARGAGTVSGEIFFWSTLGSIAGSLLSGFVLIPHFGVKAIVLTVGLALTALGLALLSASGKGKKKLFRAFPIWFTCGVAVLVASLYGALGPKRLYQHDGVYERISIFDGEDEQKRPVRYFIQDRSGSGKMYLDSDNDSELAAPYTRYYSLYKAFTPHVENALVIGGGAWSVPKALLNDLPNAHVDVAEIEPSLFDLAKKYFRAKDDPRLTNYTEDGRRLLHDSKKSYDLIFSDVYFSLYSVPAHFMTEEFFKIAKTRLAKDGLFIANLAGSLGRAQPSLLFSEIETFRAVFPNSYVFAVQSPTTTDMQNIMVVGYNSDKKMDFNAPEIKSSPDPTVRELAAHIVDMNRFELSPYALLTDDYAPVEYLTLPMLKKGFSSEKKALYGDQMMELIRQQLRYGPRHPTAPGHKAMQDFLMAEMKALTPDVTAQTWEHTAFNGDKYKMANIVARFYPEKKKRIILAAHYDTKKYASLDPRHPELPLPGANDGASGVAVLVEMGRLLATVANPPNTGVDIVFFDGEEGDEAIKNDYRQWKPLGSTYFAQHLDQFYDKDKTAKGGIVLDMVCDKDLEIRQDNASLEHAALQTVSFWRIASQLYPENFAMDETPETIDDHTPLNQAGIPTVLLIDWTYPPYHTLADTADKCSGESMEKVGNAVAQYVYNLSF